MVKAVGVDPGTKSMDVYGFDDVTGEILADTAIPRVEVTKNPAMVLDVLEETGADVIIGPGGYGMPLVPAKDATDAQILEATFMTPSDSQKNLNIVGLRRLLFLMRCSDQNIWFPPGVIHLPTVPGHRKINHIDMGTADKVFTAVAGIADESERLEIAYEETSHIVVEIGFGYTAALAVEGGRIVDGVGGSVGGLGFLGMGGMDGELAYALANSGEYPKTLLFSGGAASAAGLDLENADPEAYVRLAGKEEKASAAYKAMLEGVLKDVSVLLVSLKEPREVLLSGRFMRLEKFASDVQKALNEGLGLDTRILSPPAKNAKTAAYGAAIMASGIGGGKYAGLVDNMRLKESSGGIFDHVNLGPEITKRLEDVFTR